MIELLCNPELDNLDVRTLLLMKELKDRKILYSRSELGKLLGVSVPTITRRLTKFREMGLVKSIRLTNTVWKHHVYLPGQNQSVTERMPFPEKETNHLDDSPCTEMPNHLDDASPHIINLEKYRKERSCIIKNDPIAVSAEEKMGATGPDDLLASVISSSLERTEQARRVKKEKKLANAEHLPPQLYETPSARKHRVHEEREVSEYTVDDLEIEFQNEMKKCGFMGKPFPWTQKEKRNVKHMLKQQDTGDVLGYLQHVVQNWGNISRRYRINGPPTIAVIYGFRKGWFLEFLNGTLGCTKTKRIAEFNEAEADKIPSGSWGY